MRTEPTTMADPVTLGFTISKGVILAGEVSWSIGRFSTNFVKAPDQLAILRDEANAVELVLQRLQSLILKDTEDIPVADEIRVQDIATVVC